MFFGERNMKTAATVATSAAFMALALMALCAVNVGFATAPEDTWVSKASTLDKIGRFPDRAAVLDGKIYAVTTAANLFTTQHRILGPIKPLFLMLLAKDSEDFTLIP